ncbi:hypothetical protein K458DRAFT_402328 [Lentithecium fluviatile CBS 122367]|uniref:Uncharacterized protein n=1 Tax=Lentithecium fluviatile CBS 122367 TaxID=1168545 RepID=A0A6G1J8M3_9PLEO|nr:hypothetical protein K458DRAFT_402328 [Lentithecium fluviatile CBS 122367]
MNWTGGRLQRFKQANNGIVQKQKAHFTRARTLLENNSSSLTSPFHPSFFRDDESELSGWLPPFSSRTVRHTGHSKTFQERHSRAVHVPSRHGSREDEPTQTSTSRPREQNRAPAYGSAASGEAKRKRKADNADLEESLLEARRERLMRQQDWAGLTRSKPLRMQFPSSSEKEKIGKRRKIEGRGAPTTMPKGNPSPSRRPQTHHIQPPSAHARGALAGEKIRVRIGSDALSNLTPAQRTPIASQRAEPSRDESSDIMLFDYEEDLHTVPSPVHRPVRSEDQVARVFVGAHTPGRAAPPEMRGEGLHAHQASDRKRNSYQTGRHGETQGNWTLQEHIQGLPAGNVPADEENKVSGCYITQHIEGVNRPLRLVVDRTSDLPPAVEGDAAPRGNAIGESSHVQDEANASLHEFGNHQQPSEPDGALARHPQIVDDGPWRSLLSIPKYSSSRSTTADASVTQKLHYHSALQAFGVTDIEPLPWSQHATQGGRTCTDSSSYISASLPSIARASERDTLGKLSHDGSNGSKHGMSLAKKQRDEDEQLWRTFVFSHENAAASGTVDYEAAVDRDEDTGSRRVIPSSVVVGPLRSTPFGTVSGNTSCVTESGQDAPARAPRSTVSGSTLPTTTPSAVPPTRRQELRKSGEGDATLQTAERSGFGDHTVTHTFIQNMSHETSTSSSRISGDPWAQSFRDGLEQ